MSLILRLPRTLVTCRLYQAENMVIPTGLAIVLASILGQRLLLNIREQYYKPHMSVPDSLVDRIVDSDIALSNENGVSLQQGMLKRILLFAARTFRRSRRLNGGGMDGADNVQV